MHSSAIPVAWYPCRAKTRADVSTISSRRAFHFSLRWGSSVAAGRGIRLRRYMDSISDRSVQPHEHATASTDGSPSSRARDGASAVRTRSCSPSGARASSSTTSAARWRASAPTPARRRRWRPRSSPPGASRSPTATTCPRSTGAEALVDAAVERFGRVDILVNNAGIIRWAGCPGVRRRRSRAAPRGARHRLVQHDPRGVAAHGRAGLRPRRDDDVDRDVRAAGNLSYATAKGGVVGLTRSLAVEGAEHGIKVNAIAPAACTRMAGQSGDEPAPSRRRWRRSSSRRWSRTSRTRTVR